jgi:large subunit ribosomal protein L30
MTEPKGSKGGTKQAGAQKPPAKKTAAPKPAVKAETMKAPMPEKAPAMAQPKKAAPAKPAAKKPQARPVNGKTVTVRQVRSANRKPESYAATLRGLGLGKIRRERTLEDTPAVRGMIRKVSGLVEIVEQK